MLPKLMEVSGFYEYAKKVITCLDTMEPGSILHLQAEEEKLSWLLVTVGVFMAEGEHWIDYELNDDQTKLRRNYVPEKFRKAIRRKV